jgi:transcription elongation factor Elf1
MEKQTGFSCPRCGLPTLSVYYEDNGDLEIGATCDECGLKGFYVDSKLIPLAVT